jgi:flagella basal body P-ring formation protein FlgA
MRLLVLVALTFAAAQAAADVELSLKSEALVMGPRIRLAEVAVLSERDPATPALAAIDLGGAPLPGYGDRFTRREIERLIRMQGLQGQVVWHGAEAVRIERMSHAYATAALSAAAQAYLQGLLQGEFKRVELELAEPLPAVQVPYGEVSLKPRPLPFEQAVHRRVAVWMDVAVDGTFVRSVTVPFRVAAYKPVLVAVRDLPAGAIPQCDLLQTREMDVAALDSPPLPADCHFAQGHLKRALAQGAPLLKLNLQTPVAVAHGDSVSLQMIDGALILESRAIAMADGEVGQRINVKPSAGTEAIVAEVIAPGIVRVNGR